MIKEMSLVNERMIIDPTVGHFHLLAALHIDFYSTWIDLIYAAPKPISADSSRIASFVEEISVKWSPALRRVSIGNAECNC